LQRRGGARGEIAECNLRKQRSEDGRDPFAGLSFSERSESTKIDEAQGCRLAWTSASNVAPPKSPSGTTGEERGRAASGEGRGRRRRRRERGECSRP